MTARRASGLGTVSLRRRVTVAVIAVFVVVLVALILVVNGAFSIIVNRSVTALLKEQAQYARELAAHDTPPQELIDRLETRSVRASLVLPDGRVLGQPARAQIEQTARKVTIELSAPRGPLNGSQLTLETDGRLLAGARARVMGVLLIVAAAALVAVAVIVPLVAKFALAPLDAMTRLARGVAGGQRGERLWPAPADTELGRTATAFDDMLDALEGAERRALAARDSMHRFVSDAAHELRTPIAGIGAAVEAVLQQPVDADPETRQRLLLVLGRESRHAGRLIDDLLDMARIDSGLSLHYDTADIQKIATEQVERARLLHPELSLFCDGPPTTTTVDAARIGQVVANLLNNACAVTPAGGTVRVVLSRRSGGVRVAVHDGGPGVRLADRERIFDRLVRLDTARDRTSRGAGLGLSIARGIARAHGGDVTCESPPPGSGGAVFVLWLPDRT
ncbi:signal transduction histidine kinase [Mycobacterium sp. OAS707]|uniref:sensor histidine kinase n=1 Tax=Mycobacterium sp. OAS707 TaxID=2663822 RepID=UPI0017899F3F|nr:signal transduction histidine kinase [Mycobacterium sp. OAS707]